MSELTQTLRKLVGQQPIALFDWPNHPNGGDHFIWLGEKVLFKHRLGCNVLYECSLQQLDILRVTRLPPETVLVIHGGGNFGDLWRHHHRFREAIITAFPDRRIVIMPQTVHFLSHERLQESARVMKLHPDLHVMARDRKSLSTLRSQMGLLNCYLHIDSAFALQPIVAALLPILAANPESDVLYLLRRDIESAETAPHAQGVACHDWGRADDMAQFAIDLPSPNSIEPARGIFDGEFDAYSWRQLCAAVRLFSVGRRIVTDRLHGHILALMMGKEHDLHDNTYGKNSAFYREWTHASPLVTFVGLVEREVAPAGPSDQNLSAQEMYSTPIAGALTNPKKKEEAAAKERKRLGIVIPYRNRDSHLSKFLPHLISYFQREDAGKSIQAKILLAEQRDDLPFNRGGLLNAGFLAIADQVDYVCFHDVDYLPMWADYSYPDAPTRIIWWGMHSGPIRVKDPSLRTHAPLRGLCSVTLFTVESFRAVNGYSNRFFGWGFGDKDLAARCRLHSLPVEQRDGTFIPLEHDNAGFREDGSKSPAWLENERRFAENQQEYERHGVGGDGLSSFAGQVNPIESVRVCGLDGADEADVLYLSVNFDQSRPTYLNNAETTRLLRSLSSSSTSAEAGLARTLPAPAAVPVTFKDIKKSRSQKICLSMIVKDEVAVIARCLASVRPLIDYWVIVDTGSTDGTQNVIRDFFQDMPGELHELPWVDFAHNRSEALTLARNHGDYSLIIDADDVLELPPGFRLPFLKEDSIVIEIRNQGRRLLRPQLVRNTVPWRYEGVLHEFLSCVDKDGRRVFAERRSQKRLPGVKIVMTEEGARRRSSSAERYRRDALVIENALQTETDPFLVARYKFYLAQSYLDAGEKQKALTTYQERAKLGFWNQEIFISLYRSAKIKAELGYDADDVIESYRQADRVVAGRAEAPYDAARFCRQHDRFQEGFEFAKRALNCRPPADGLFVDDWVYDYGVLDEYAVNAYWTDRFADCLSACERLLRNPKVPAETRQRVEQNARFAREKLSSRQTGTKPKTFEGSLHHKRAN